MFFVGGGWCKFLNIPQFVAGINLRILRWINWILALLDFVEVKSSLEYLLRLRVSSVTVPV